MKLYFYFLETPYKGEPYIRFEECEVINNPKTYKPVDKFPSGYYGCYVRKEDIGTLTGYGKDIVVLTTDDSEVALKLFVDKANKEIGQHEYQIKKQQAKLKAVNDWRSANASNNQKN